MFDCRLTAPRFTTFVAALLFTASSAGFAAAQSAAVSGDQWRAAGSAPASSQSAATSSGAANNTVWSQPNDQANTTNAQSNDNGPNPLRKGSPAKPAAAPREPQAFRAPVNAKPLNSSQSAAVSNVKPASQNHSTSAAVTSKPMQVANQAYMPPRVMPIRAPMPAPQQRPAAQPQPVTWAMGSSERNNQPKSESNGDDLWHTINVAFQGTPPATKNTKKQSAPENLPMPGDFDSQMQNPVMRQPSGPDAFRQPVCGPYYRPYCDQGPCCDDGSCPNGCGPNGCCGDVFEPGCGCPCGAPCGEPGCACEPGCGCPNDQCGGCCGKKEVFCIGPGDDESCHIVQIRWPKWQEVEVFGGVQGFKGPYDRDRDSGNFGFNEGFNIGAKIPYAEMGYQYGYRATESQLNGDKDTGIENQFLQEFVTAGLFHRSTEGLQFGVVWDALIDERSRSENFHQIRSELSLLGGGCHEIGFNATIGLNRKGFDDGNGDKLLFQASDQYLLFYRFHGPKYGEGRVFVGANNDSDGIVGSDMRLPIGDRFSVQAGFAYLIPNGKNGTEGASQEAWNIGLGLVWHWDAQARKSFNNCYRPLFNVADNGTLIVDQQDRNN